MYNKNMITLARELRGVTQTALAERTGRLSQIELSNLETGRAELTKDNVELLGRALNLPLSFFAKEDPVVKRISKFYYRKRNTLPAKDLHIIEAQIKVLRQMLLALLREVEIDVKDLPRWLPKNKVAAEEIANKTRLFFNLDDGPVENLISILEHHGIPVIFLNAPSNKFSGMTVQTDVNMNIIILNKNMPNDHKRFTLAHELGHLIMHIPFANEPEFLSSFDDLEEIEEQADRFAGAFLMPAKEVRRQISHSFTYSRLTELKLYWKVSKQALIYRAKDLQVISPQKFTNLFVELSRYGERKKELLEVPIDEPRLFKEMMTLWEASFEKTKQQMAEEIAGIPIDDFQDWMGLPKPLLRAV